MTSATPLTSQTPHEPEPASGAERDRDVASLRQALKESEARFATLAEAMPHIVWSAPPNGEPDYYNGSWYALTGMPVGAVSGRSWADYIHPDDVSEAQAAWSRSLATGDPYAVEYRIRDQTRGGWRWFLGRAHPVRDAGGAIQRWFGTGTDIDEVVTAREALARNRSELARLVAERTAELVEANRRLAAEMADRQGAESARRDVDALYTAYIDNTTDGVFVVAIEPDGRSVVETVNSVVERALSVERGEIRGLSPHDLLAIPVADMLAANLRACLIAEKPLRYEETVQRLGSDRVYEVSLVPVRGADGRIARIVGSARDLTERRSAEQQLRQAQKMEAVGQLTGGIAHDFNNLLQVVKGNLDLLAVDLAGSAAWTPSVERRLRDAMAGAERGAKLTRQLLAFSRKQPLAPQSVDVGALIASMTELLDRTLGETVEVVISQDHPSRTALVDPAQLENAVLNLAINARDAMERGGRLTIAVTNLGDDEVEIAVSDTGAGMEPRVLARVFEPFFSTKPEGRGTGLGLPQVQGFIEQSNGRMEIESAPGIGTTVRLVLPRGGDAPELANNAPMVDTRGRGERILLVEDDEAVRRAVADLLAALGYAVTAAGSTREAAAALGPDAPFDLLLSDVVMPGAPTPPEFARAARLARPGLKVLFMSGYAENVIVHDGRIDADVHLIEKPYRKDELSMKLRRLLDEPQVVAGPDAAAPEAAASRRVLLVEDEPLIAMGVSDLLASFGYSVVEAYSAADAKAAFARDSGIDIVLTDLGLPDMDGESLAQWCRRERPGVPIVFSTGRSDFEPPADLSDGGPIGVVTKPFDGQTLRRTLDACRPAL